ncbi:MAG: S46 family peptidase [Myxococcales bacterium]|nr:S46 family peptidase [Myxococcales bacterium]
MIGLRAIGKLNTWAWVAGLSMLAMGCKKPVPQPPKEEPFVFENPGGMWMPSQLAEHKSTLEKLGVAIPVEQLADPTAFPLGAVVSLGGCSASFVSPDGLVVTNHHCVIRYLQNNSTPEKNLLEDGYLAATRADELPGGRGARIYVSNAFTDVTDQILGGLGEIADNQARATELEKRVRTTEETCEAGKTGMRCVVASYFEGAQFIQIEQLEIKDVRLVYAPDAGIGVFGGEIDNWQWPRHTGDYSFLRAYVGPDGQPAEPAADNVPYKPPHYLKVASEPLKEGDFAMVAGYPGSTYRLKTAAEVREAVDWYYPERIKRYDEYITLYESLGQENPALAIKTASRMRGLANYRKNFQGMLDGLTTGGLADAKGKLEADLQAWIEADPERKAKYGTVLADMAALQEAGKERRDYDEAVGEILRGSSLLGMALAVRKIAVEREKPAEERRPGFSDAEIERMVAAMKEEVGSNYDADLERAVVKLALNRAASLPEGQRPDVLLEALLGAAATPPLDEAAVDKALGKLYGKTKLNDPAALEKLATSPLAKVDKSKDPLLQAAVSVELVVDDMERRDKEKAGAMASLRPVYIQALREFTGSTIAPDANGTLRVTFGTVRGYTAPGAAEPYAPFTTVSQMVAKNTGAEPFDAPESIIAAANSKQFGPYADETLGDLPLDFLADLDITGGNSGSPTLNARGELIGLAFDGNYESIASDWLFMPAVTRSIHVDIRYILWIMDAVDNADHLLTEMGVTPSLPAEGGAAPADTAGPADTAAPAEAAPADAAAAAQ